MTRTTLFTSRRAIDITNEMSRLEGLFLRQHKRAHKVELRFSDQGDVPLYGLVCAYLPEHRADADFLRENVTPST